MNVSLRRVLRFLSNPFVLALVPATIVLAIISPKQQKYVLELVQGRNLSENTFVFYEDITGDGYSERIELRDRLFATAFIVYSPEGSVIDDWRLSGNLDLVRISNVFYAGDYNGDGQKEMFFFTVARDSVFLHALFDLDSHGLHISNRFITTIKKSGPSYDTSLYQVSMEDLDGDGLKELMFILAAGYTLDPRAVFAYHIDQDSLIRSPASNAMISRFETADINGDGRPEIICSNNSPANISPENAQFHDHSNWVMVLDHHLNFLFDPVEIPSRFDNLYAFPYKEEDAGYAIAALRMQSHSDNPSKAYYFSHTGKLLKQDTVHIPGHYLHFVQDMDGNPWWAVTQANGDLWLYDTGFNLIKKHAAIGLQYYDQDDLDACGKSEMIAYGSLSDRLSVFRDGFKHPASFQIESDGYYAQISSIVNVVRSQA